MKNKLLRQVFVPLMMFFPVLQAVAQPPCATNPIANDFCGSATPICNLNGYCGNTSAFYTNSVSPTNGTNETFTPLGDVFCATIQNNSWLKFIADSTIAVFSVWCSNCEDNHGIQMQIYTTSDCYNFTPVSNCWNPMTPTNGQILATGLTPGNVYYFMIDGTMGDVCDYVIACDVGVTVAPAISLDQTICGGTTAHVAVTGGVNYTWSSSPPDPSMAGQLTSPSLDVTPATTTIYTVTVTNPGINTFCTTDTMILSTTVTVDVITALVSSVTPSYCGQPTGEAVIQVTGGIPPLTFSWNTSPPQTSVNLQNVLGGTYTLTVTDSLNCNITQTVTIASFPAPAVSLSPFPTMCTNQGPMAMTGGSPAGGTYNGPGITNNIFNPAQTGPGTFQVIYNYTNTVGCSGADTQNVTVNPAPAVFLASPGDFCQDADSVTLTTGSPAGGTYFGAGVIAGGIFDPFVTGPGTFTIGYRYTDALGCSDTAFTTVEVFPLPQVQFPPLPAICLDEGIQGLPTVTPAGGTFSGTGVSDTLFDPQVSGAGIFPVTYTFIDAQGCTSQAIQDMTVNPLPAVFEVTGGGVACFGTGGLPVGLDTSQADIRYHLLLNGMNYGTSLIGTGAPLTFSGIETGGQFTILAIDVSTGCDNLMEDTVQLSFLPRPSVNLGDSSLFLCDLPELILDAGTTQDSVQFEWQDGSNARTFRVTEPGEYWVKVLAGNCFGGDTIEILDCSGLEIPNVYTPNSDGINDRFLPKKNGEILDYHIEVFNRWGTRVYESSDLEEGWDGTLFNNGARCSEGVYFFVASYTAHIYPQPDRQARITGSVTLLR